MHTYAVEARRGEGAPWMPVTTVQEDLVDDVAQIVADGPTPGDWRIRQLDEPEAPAPVERETAKITVWDRLRWWAMFRFSRKARR